jgi:gamma-glutamylcyclotransferase (GGCT)/AIG2-like uncharacterized protein YtfP
MNSAKKVNLIISLTVLLGTLFSQTIPVAIAQENVLLAVNGTLMRGLELEPNLVNLGATFVREDRTEPAYRLYSINDIHPAMVRVQPMQLTVYLWL